MALSPFLSDTMPTSQSAISRMLRSRGVQFIVLIAAGLVGALLAESMSIPLPFMIGGLFGALPVVWIVTQKAGTVFYPSTLRKSFIALIGAMIGGTISPDMVSQIPAMIVSIIGMALFVPLAQASGYQICRRIGGYDPVTALFAAMPGGLIEAVELGKKNGGDASILILAHFLRIVCVVVLVPTGFLIVTGEVVGSAGGQTLATGASGVWDVLQVASLAGIGFFLGRISGLPAYHLVGPMLVSTVAHGAGIIETSSADWLLFLSQLVVGVGLATNFSGASLALLARVVPTTAVQVASMGAIGVFIAYVCAKISGQEFAALILSFSPGGVTEMGLIALSLSLSPVVVTTHHVFRIFMTVVLVGYMARRLDR